MLIRKDELGTVCEKNSVIRKVSAYLHIVHNTQHTHAQRNAKPPSWVKKMWFVTIVVFELMSVIMFILALSSKMLWPIKLVFMGGYLVAIIGCSVSVVCIIDVAYNVFKNTDVSSKPRRVHDGDGSFDVMPP